MRVIQPRIEALVDRLLDAVQEHGTIDLIEDFAAAIPVEIIGNLLGVPHADRGPLRGWSLAILGALEPVLTDYCQESASYLRAALPNARGIEVRDALLALNDLRAEAAAEILPLLESPKTPHAELMLEVLTWSRDPRVACGHSHLRDPVLRAAPRRRRVETSRRIRRMAHPEGDPVG